MDMVNARKLKEKDNKNNLPFPSDDCLPLFFLPIFNKRYNNIQSFRPLEYKYAPFIAKSMQYLTN